MGIDWGYPWNSEMLLTLVGGLEHEWIIFHSAGNVIIPTDFHIFQRGRYTTNQVYVCAQYVCMSIYRSIDRSIYLLVYIYIYKYDQIYVCVITCNLRACFKSIFVFMCLSVRKLTRWLFCFSMCGKDADEIILTCKCLRGWKQTVHTWLFFCGFICWVNPLLLK